MTALAENSRCEIFGEQASRERSEAGVGGVGQRLNTLSAFAETGRAAAAHEVGVPAASTELAHAS